MRMPRSIRARITIVAVGASALVLGITSVVMAIQLRRQLADNFDEGLAQRTGTIAAVLANSSHPTLPLEEDLLVQYLDADGKVQLASSNLGAAPAIGSIRPGYQTTRGIVNRTETFRVLTVAVPTGARHYLLVGINYDDVLDPAQILSRLLWITVPCVVSLLGVLTWVLTSRTLRPVEYLRTELAEISATNLGRRVHRPNTGDEVDRLATTMNDTLDRLEDAVRRQQRFVADASHELRGPLTRIRSELEIGLAHPDVVDLTKLCNNLLTETTEMQYLVGDLLSMAQSDANADVQTRALVDLDDIIGREARRLRDRGRVAVDTRRVGAAQVVGDIEQLTRAVRNLFENAERHAVSTVAVTLDDRGDEALLTVCDDGAGIAAEHREHIFERFTRLDEARTRDGGGTGRGLAIVRDIVQRHGGTITLAQGRPTRFVVTLPARASR